MPVVINYHSVDGLLLGETGASGRRDYLPDALGSTMGTADGTTGALKNEYRYRPYGGFLLQGSLEPDPAFLWTGGSGSRSSGAPHAGQYNRARHYARETGRWTSVDPLWPEESAYGYVMGNPTTWVDPDGMQTIVPRPGLTGATGTPCFVCAQAIVSAWWDHPIHAKDANHSFVHCLACCTLTQFVSKGCASEMQDLQNVVSLREPDHDNRVRYRNFACKGGIQVADEFIFPVNYIGNHDKCVKGCAKRFPLPKPKVPMAPIKPPPRPPECDPDNWKTTFFHPAPAYCPPKTG